MHILITNDDGIDSPGLFALKQALDPLGDVSVIAPDSNRSATARSITILRPLHVEERRLPDGSLGYATDGTPVDCVRFAVLGLLDKRIPDVIVSGINHGLNLGDDVTYSGTVAAAFEGVLLGWPSIAVSQQSTNREHWDTGTAEYDFRAVAAFVAKLVPLVADPTFPRHMLVNVNAPGELPENVAGARATRLGRRIYNDSLELQGDTDGRKQYLIYGGQPGHHSAPGTDFAAIEERRISVTPLHFDLTDTDGVAHLHGMDLDALLTDGAA